MTKVYVARPPTLPKSPVTPAKNYAISPDARASMTEDHGIIEPLKYDLPSKGLYVADGKWMYDIEFYILDTQSKLPIRAVNLKTGDKKTFTDRLGCARFTLPRGHHEILVEGFGYLEKGNFTPQAKKFEPIVLKLDLDSDSVFTIYSTGEVVPGERALANPGHNPGTPGDLAEFLRQYGLIIGFIGATGIGMYYLGKSKTSA